MSGVEESERYRCLVSIAGVSDPEMLIADARHFLNRREVQKFIGRDAEVIKPVEYIKYEDVEHSVRRNGYRVDMLDRIGSFVDAHIGQPTAAP